MPEQLKSYQVHFKGGGLLVVNAHHYDLGEGAEVRFYATEGDAIPELYVSRDAVAAIVPYSGAREPEGLPPTSGYSTFNP